MTVCVALHRPSRNACGVARLEHAVVVVEAVEVVGDADGVRRQRVGRAPLGGFGDDGRKLDEPLDEAALLGRELGRDVAETGASPALRMIPAMRACAYWT